METTQQQAKPSLTEAFETQTCTRCGGGGNYSYCQMYGTTCFGCSGKGVVYTKRAQAALDYARKLRTVKVADVQVGWILWNAGGPFGKAGWYTVTKSETTNDTCTSQNGVTHTYWDLETSQGSTYTFPNDDVQSVPDKARLREVKALALAYQATLTKAGTVRKCVESQLSPEVR